MMRDIARVERYKAEWRRKPEPVQTHRVEKPKYSIEQVAAFAKEQGISYAKFVQMWGL